jgi:hypothetical protein
MRTIISVVLGLGLSIPACAQRRIQLQMLRLFESC